jgi:hypothetical protein
MSRTPSPLHLAAVLAASSLNRANPHPNVGAAIGDDPFLGFDPAQWADFTEAERAALRSLRARVGYDDQLRMQSGIARDENPFLGYDPDLDADLVALDFNLGAMEGDLDMIEELMAQGPGAKGYIGATFRKLGRQMGQAQRDYDNAARRAETARNPGQRMRAQVKANQAKQRLDSINRSAERKQTALAQKLGIQPEAIGVLGPQQISERERRASMGAANAAAGQLGVLQRTPYSGAEIRIPFEVDGAPLLLITIANGAGLRVAPIVMATQAIPFARFKIIGVDTSIFIARGQNAQGFPNSDILPTCILSTVQPDGGNNLLYRAEPVEFAAQGNYGNRTIAGLRENPELERNNFSTLTGVWRQEITTAVTYNATFKAALLVEKLADQFGNFDV